VTDAARPSLDELIVHMDERAALVAVRERLGAGEDPAALIDECRAGMEQVGKLYEEGRYYISALIMAGEIFREAAELSSLAWRRPACKRPAARWSSPP
jgi:methanogenic corrinoid protein MtbC1